MKEVASGSSSTRPRTDESENISTSYTFTTSNTEFNCDFCFGVCCPPFGRGKMLALIMRIQCGLPPPLGSWYRNDFLRSFLYFVGWTIDRLLNICLIFTTWLVSDGHTAAVGVEICKTRMDDDTLDDMVLFPSKVIRVCENSVFVFYCLGLMSVFPYFIGQSDHSRQQWPVCV